MVEVVEDMVVLLEVVVDMVVLQVVEEDMVAAHLKAMEELLSVEDMVANPQEEIMVEHPSEVAMEAMMVDMVEHP